MRPHLVGKMVDIDDGGLDAGLSQTIKRVIDQGLARDRHQGLGLVVG